MDLGVGGFVFSSALSSKKSYQQTWLSRILQSIQSSSPLLVLGLIRLFSVKATEYQEHVTEYGIHWNFFFTLAFLTIGTAIFDLGDANKNALLGVFMLLGYQIGLSWFGLT